MRAGGIRFQYHLHCLEPSCALHGRQAGRQAGREGGKQGGSMGDRIEEREREGESMKEMESVDVLFCNKKSAE